MSLPASTVLSDSTRLVGRKTPTYLLTTGLVSLANIFGLLLFEPLGIAVPEILESLGPLS